MKMKKKFKAIIALAMSVVMVLCFTACGGGGGTGESGEQDVYELKFANIDAEDLPTTDSCYWIAEQLEERTDGGIKVTVYPGGQLGDISLLMEGLMDGSIDMAECYVESTYDNVFDLFTIPYLASDPDQYKYLYSQESNAYQIYTEHMDAIGIKFMGFYLNGFNGLFSTDELGDYLNPEVKKNILIRIANSELYKLGMTALGYNTVTIPYADTYTSLQTGVCDGMVGIPPYMVAQNFSDVTECYAALDAWGETCCYMMSPAAYDALPEEYQKIVDEVFMEASMQSIEDTKVNQEKGLNELEELGIEVLPVTEEDRARIAEYMIETLQPDLERIFGQEILDQINEDIANSQAAEAE